MLNTAKIRKFDIKGWNSFQTWQDNRNFNIWSTVNYILVKCTLLPPHVKSVITNDKHVVCRPKVTPNMTEDRILKVSMEQTFKCIRAFP